MARTELLHFFSKSLRIRCAVFNLNFRQTGPLPVSHFHNNRSRARAFCSSHDRKRLAEICVRLIFTVSDLIVRAPVSQTEKLSVRHIYTEDPPLKRLDCSCFISILKPDKAQSGRPHVLPLRHSP